MHFLRLLARWKGGLTPISSFQTDSRFCQKKLTEEESLRQSRDDIKKWKEDQSTQVQEKILDLEARMSRYEWIQDSSGNVIRIPKTQRSKPE